MKICGLTKPQDVDATAQAGAAYAGFVFFPKSPRHVAIDTARDLAVLAPIGLAKVALVVNADDALLDEITGKVAIDILQLHGSESPQRVSEIRARYGLPVMKAVGVASAGDVQNLATYEQVCDQILVDAKAPKGAALPGGNGLAFDWKLIAGRRWARPWMLAGGLTPENVARAVELTGAAQVDVSSGVESAPGQKDVAKIAAFVSAATSSQEIPKL